MPSWGNALVVGAALAVGVVALRGKPAASVAPVARMAPVARVDHELAVPVHAGAGALVIDGELEEPIWHGAVARTGAFLDASGAPARPYSDARLVSVGDDLVVALYAADEDIRTAGSSRDLFRVTIGATTFEVSATGELVGAPRGTRVGHDLDGTLDDASDDDEEWVIELAIPWASLDLPSGRERAHVAFEAERCDVTRDGARSCSSTRATLVGLAAQLDRAGP